MASEINLKVLSYGSVLRKAVSPVLYLSKEATLKFAPNGLTLVASHPATCHTVLVLRMESKNFDFFYCNEDVSVGVNLEELYKIVSLTTDDECITITESDCSQDQVSIGLGFPHCSYRERIFCDMKLNEDDHLHLRVAAVNFSYDVSVGIPSKTFREIIVCMRQSTEVSVTITEEHVRFSAVDKEMIVTKKPGECIINSISPSSIYPVLLKLTLRHMFAYLSASVMPKSVWLFYCPDTPTLLLCHIKSIGTFYFYFFDEPQQS